MPQPASPRLIQQAYRYELAPTEDQVEQLLSFTGAARYAFNWGLGLVKQRLELRSTLGPSVPIPWSYKELCSEWARVKDEVAPWRDEVIVGSFQTGLQALGQALQGFSDARGTGRRRSFPHFKARGRCRESVFSQDARLLDSRHIRFPKVGAIRTKEPTRKLARLLERDAKARILRGTITRSSAGRWFISFTVERSPKQRKPRKPRAVIGVDLGLAKLATLSTGQTIENSRPLQAALKRLRRLQRRLDRQRRANNPANYLSDGCIRPGPKQWRKSQRQLDTEAMIQRLHERVANLRREQAHQLTTALTREYGVIGVESLNVAGMLQNHNLARQISDVSWGLILQQLHYKTSWAGGVLVSAPTFYPSSKTCSSCGAVKAKLSLSERVFTCESCGLTLDRDENAALNLAQLAIEQAVLEGVRSPYVARASRETLNARGGRPSRSVKREDSAPESPQEREPLASVLN